MAAVMRALIAAVLVTLCVPAHAEVVSMVIGYIGSAASSIGAVVGSTAFAVGVTALSIVSSAYANSQAKKKARQEAARKLAQDIANLSDRRVTLLQSDSPHAVIYGQPGRIGGSIVGMLATGAGNQHTHIIMVFASHPCEAIDEIYIGDDPVQAGPDGWTTNPDLIKDPSGPLDFDHGPMVHISVHLSPGGVDVADQWLIDQVEHPVWGFPGQNLWTADHKLSGYTYAVITVNKVMDRFQGGPPEITARIRGKNTIYDPRTGTRGYTRNPALCVADFIMSEEGYGASLDQIDTNALIAAANACDQEVYGPEADDDAENYGNSRALYVCDGMFRSDQDRDSTRQQIEEAMAGFSLQSAGVWRIQAGAWSTPVLTLSDTDMLAPMTVVQTANPGARVYNTARGTYINAARNGVSEDFKQYQNSVFLGLDPHEKVADMALAFTASHVRCHQIARVTVERSRGGMVLRINPKMLAWHLQPGDRILLTSAFHGFENKTFIVTDWSYSREAPLTLEVLEDVPNYYDTADETLADAAPNTNLPNPFAKPPAPQNLQVESGADQLVVQGASVQVKARVSWNRSTSSYVLHGGIVRVQWRMGATDPTQPDPPDVDPWHTVDVPGDAVEAFLLGLDVGAEYTVRARFQTEFASSDWAYAGHTLIGGDPPAQVDGLALVAEPDGIHAYWLPPEGIDLAEWDRTVVGRGATVIEAEADIRFDGHATGANLGWFPVGDQTVWALHHSRAGLWSDPASASINILPPATPVVSAEKQGRTVALSWQDCRTTQPIREYIIALGNSAELATEVARAATNSAQRVESTSDLLYTYWVRAVDMAGNVSGWGRHEVMVLPDPTDSTDLTALLDRARAQLEYLADRMAALQIRGALQAESAVARAREKLGNDIMAVGTVIEQVREQSVTAAEALASELSIIASQFMASLATVQTEVTTLATEQSAQATQLITLVAEVEDDRAYYTSRIEALVDEDEAISSQLVTLSADFAGNQASVALELQALANADEAMASQFIGLESAVGDNAAAIASEASTRASQHNAQASLISGLTTRVGNAESAITTEATTRASQHNAQAELLDTLRADVNFISARYITQTQVTATVNSAIATNNTWLQSSVGPVGELEATVHTSQATVASLEGNVAAQHMIRTVLGAAGKQVIASIVTGVSSTSAGANVQSEVVVSAGSFRVVNDTGGSTLYPVFKVEGGVTYMDMARIKDADIGTLKIAGRAVVQPMVTSGTPTASLSFVVPPGQVWDVAATAGYHSTLVPDGITNPNPRSMALTITGAVGASRNDTVYPAQRGEMTSGEDSIPLYAYPNVVLTGGGALGAGNYTITATSSGGNGAAGTVDLTIIVGKAGA